MSAGGAGLEIRDLRVLAPDGAALVRGVSLTARPGVPLTLLGETGSGKSLVLAAAMGVLAPALRAEGSVRLDGVELLGAPAPVLRRLWGRRLALLPQEPWLALDPTMRALGQVAEVFRVVRGLPRAEARAEAGALLAALGLAEAGRRFPFQLSGGMAQRVALAVLRAADAPVLLADEPTKGLDAARRDEAALRLREEADRGRTVLAVTHDVAVARALGGEAAVMLDGGVVERGEAARVLSSPSHPYARRLLAAEPSFWPPRAPRRAGGDVVVEGRGLAKGLGGRPVLRGADIAVRRGEVVAVLGPSGCGKTTLGDLLLGLLRPDAGEARRAPGFASWRFQKLYQDPPSAFAPRLTLRRALADLARRHGLGPGAFEAPLARLRLPAALLDRRPDEVSGGELQRFALLRALALDPVFLFADEPTSRLDPVTQEEVAALLRACASERGLGVLLVTHDAALAGKLADRVLQLGSGTLHDALAAGPAPQAPVRATAPP